MESFPPSSQAPRARSPTDLTNKAGFRSCWEIRVGSRVDSVVGGLPSESQLNCGTREFCVARVLEMRCKAEFLTACYRSLGFLGRRWAVSRVCWPDSDGRNAVLPP